MNKAREIQKQITRPTSVAVMLIIFQGFKLAFPDAMGADWQNFTIDAISVIGATGIIDKAWRNRKEIINWFTNIFKKQKQNG